MKNINLYITLLSVLSFFNVFGQEELNLSQAIEMGLKNNFQIQISQKNIEITQNNNNWGQAGRYPTVNFRLTQGNRIQNNNNPTSFIQGQITSNSLSPSLEANWTLFNGFQVSITKEQLVQLQKQSMGNAQIIIENTIQAITIAYYRQLFELKKLEIIKQTFNLSKDKYFYLLDKKAFGVSTTFEVLQEKTAYLNDSLNVITQQYNVENTQRNLNLLLAIDSETMHSLSSKLILPSNEYLLEDLEKKMLENNQSLQNQYINLAIFKQNTALQKSAMYPTLSLNLGTSYNASRLERGEQSATGESNDYYANFVLNFTLFNGNKIKTAIKNAHIQEEIANIEKEELSFNLKNQLRNFHSNYSIQQQRYKIQLETQKTTKLNLDLARERFKTGLINSFDFRAIQLIYLNTELQLIEQVFQIINVETEITRLIGGYLK